MRLFSRMLTAKDTSLRVRLIELVLLAVLPALALILYNAGDQRRLAKLKAENAELKAEMARQNKTPPNSLLTPSS